MKITTEITDLAFFHACGDAKETQEIIVKAKKGEAFMFAVEAGVGEMTDTELNDLLRFEPEYCFSLVGLDKDGKYPKEEEDEDTDEEE